jgi:hypothetical protein
MYETIPDLVPAIESADSVLTEQAPKLLCAANPYQESLNCAGFIDIPSKPPIFFKDRTNWAVKLCMKIFAMYPAGP